MESIQINDGLKNKNWMTKRMIRYVKIAKMIFQKSKLQISIILLMTALFMGEATGCLPSIKDLSAMLMSSFEKYGLGLIMVASILENLIIINSYIPGSIVIISAMSIYYGRPEKALAVFFVFSIGAIIAHHINYLLGKKMSQLRPNLSKTHKKSVNKGLIALFLFTLWHPQLASVTCVLAGSRNIPYPKFVAHFLVIGFFWSIFWASLFYYLGSVLHVNEGIRILMIIYYLYLLLWLIRDLRDVKNIEG